MDRQWGGQLAKVQGMPGEVEKKLCSVLLRLQ